MFCQNCGAEISENAKFCPECGVKINLDEDQQYEDYQKPDYNQVQTSHNRSAKRNGRRLCIVALVLSILSGLVGIWEVPSTLMTHDYYYLEVGQLYFDGIIGLIFSILAILFALISFKRGNRKFIVTGIFLAIAAVSLIISIRGIIINFRFEQMYDFYINYF